jgi:hypothetical protein
MIAQTPWLRIDWDFEEVTNDKLSWEICLTELMMFWEIPPAAKEIRLTAYRRPSKWRQKVMVGGCKKWYHHLRQAITYIDSVDGCTINEGLFLPRSTAERVANRTVYVEVKWR